MIRYIFPLLLVLGAPVSADDTTIEIIVKGPGTVRVIQGPLPAPTRRIDYEARYEWLACVKREIEAMDELTRIKELNNLNRKSACKFN